MTENQTNEMFRLMTTAITKIDGLENKFNESEEKNEKFRQETKQNFEEVNQKLRL